MNFSFLLLWLLCEFLLCINIGCGHNGLAMPYGINGCQGVEVYFIDCIGSDATADADILLPDFFYFGYNPAFSLPGTSR